MILDILDKADSYYCLHPRFHDAFEFLRRGDLTGSDLGKQEIAGGDIYALFQKEKGRKAGSARLEAHRKFVDIQFLIGGDEQTGWRAVADCESVFERYDETKDIEFFSDPIQTHLHLRPGMFAIFFPGDAHAPMISDGIVHKCVVKVRID